MNYGISILFRAIPLLMGAVCLSFGLYVLAGAPGDAGHIVSGHVLIALTAICVALFTTAAMIIRQLTDTFARAWKYVLPVIGYGAAAAAATWGLVLRGGDPTVPDVVSGHIVFGVGLVAACVATVGTASSSFTLIPRNAAGSHDDGPPSDAYVRAVGVVLLAVPVLATVELAVWGVVLLTDGTTAGFTAGHVVLGLGAICSSLIALVGTVVRQVRNVFDEPERWSWSIWVLIMGSATILWGLFVLFGSARPERIAPGCVLIGLGLVCFSIISKVWLLASVWRRDFPLANRVPLIPVFTCLACLFFSAFLSEAATDASVFFVPARVLAGLGAVCFTLFSIVSILEAGTSKQP